MENNKSYRIKTNVGENINIKLNIPQSYETLEILSLKLFQKDLYTSDFSNYGVIIGRAQSKGVGIPNCKISIFIPLTDEDEKNKFIKQIYPFKSVNDIGNDNKRYNLLPKIKENTPFNKHSITNDAYDENNFGLGFKPDTPLGSFFVKDELCSNEIYVQVYEKYYKYTTTTNQSGDYCIFGCPTGNFTLHLDCDLTDIGRWSLKPVTMSKLLKYPENLFENNGTKISKNINISDSPHIQTQNKPINIIPFVGLTDVNNQIREIGITRVDFDLNVNILPTFTIFGSGMTMPKNSYWFDYVNFRCAVGLYSFGFIPLPLPYLHFDFTSNANHINGGKFDLNPFHFEVKSLDIIDSGTTNFNMVDFNADPEDFNGGVYGDYTIDDITPFLTDKLLLQNHRSENIKIDVFDHSLGEPVLLAKSNYIFEQNFGSYYIIIPTNTNLVITNEIGELIPSTNPNVGFPTKFLGSIHFKMDGDIISDSSKIVTDRLWMKIPQDINYDTNPTEWINKYFEFEQNLYYSTIQNWWGNGNGDIYKSSGGIQNIRYNTNDMIDVNEQTNMQRINMHFTLYFLQYGHRAFRRDREDPPNNRRAFAEGLVVTRDSNYNEIGGGLLNTQHLADGSNFKTNFIKIPRKDIITFLKEPKKSNFTISNLTGLYYMYNGNISIDPPNMSTNFAFYKGLKNSDCFKFLYRNNIF